MKISSMSLPDGQIAAPPGPATDTLDEPITETLVGFARDNMCGMGGGEHVAVDARCTTDWHETEIRPDTSWIKERT